MRSFNSRPGRLRRSKPPASANVVHANALSAFAFANHGLPMVVTEHHYVLDPAYRPYTTFLQFLYHRLVIGPSLAKSFHVADILTTHSQFTACVLLNANIRRIGASYSLMGRLRSVQPDGRSADSK